MGGMGEENLEELVNDYLEPPITVPDHMAKSSCAITFLQEILRKEDGKEKEVDEKIKSFIRRNKLSFEGDDEKRDMMKKIESQLRSEGYDVSIPKTSWIFPFDNREGCRSVFNCLTKSDYIDVMVTSDGDGDDGSKTRLVIDLDFKSHFKLARQSEDYKEIMQMLPAVFVAKEERLKRVVEFVCCEMKKSLKKVGISKPPWRTSRFMLAKWLPENR